MKSYQTISFLGVIGCLWAADADPSSVRSLQSGPTLGVQLPGYPPASVQYEFDQLVRLIDWNQVENDIGAVLTNSQEWWPADYGNYGGLFIRLSWHTCGSYRTSDGRGGCDGGAQR
jgi:catalase-peroxidase